MSDLDALRTRYAEAFQLFLDGFIDQASDLAGQLGAEVRDVGGGLESLVEIHTACFGKVAETTDPLSAGKVLMDSSPLLVRGVMGYAMKYCLTDVMNSLGLELETQRRKLQEAASRVREEDEFRTLFATPISHELRGPLNSIIGFANILLNEWSGPLNPEQKDNVSLILGAGHTLLSLINDLVDIGRIESGVTRLNSRAVAVEEILRTVVAQAGDSPLKIDASTGPVTIVTDERRLVQALDNLMNGVVSLAAGPVSLTVAGAPGLELTVVFPVENLPETLPENFFQPLYRPAGGQPLSRTGLSLFLARLIIRDLLGGSVSLATGPGPQVTLSVLVPETAAPESAAAEET